MTHYLTIRNYIQRLKYEIDVLRVMASGTPTLSIKEMMFEAGLKALEG